MIRNKEAALFVIYNQDKPIAINLVNFSDTTMLDVIRVFDIDYARYRLGVVGIMKQIEWCIENNFKAFLFYHFPLHFYTSTNPTVWVC